MELSAGQVLGGRYELVELRGRGGMGEVWAATDRELGHNVAVKVMLSLDEHNAERFDREARLLKELDSPHLPRLYASASLDDDRRFMVLELLEGHPLSDCVKEQGLPVERAVGWLLQAMEGLAVAHALGVVHRDLKPSNIFVCGSLEDATIKLLDFGISKRPPSMRVDEPTLTVTGASMGSPGYMSPEQLRDTKRVDTRTDIWALGLCMHRCLTGRAAFEAQDVGEYFAMIMTEPPTPLRRHAPDAPARLESIILRCTEREAERRYPDVAALADALAPFADDGAERAARIRAALGSAAAPPGSSPAESDTLTATVSSGAAVQVDAPAPLASPARRLTPVIAIAALALGGVLAALSFGRTARGEAPVLVSGVVPTPSVPAVAVEPAESAPAASATVVAQASAAASTTKPSEAPPTVVRSTPSPASPPPVEAPAPVATPAPTAPRLPKSAVGGPIEVDL